MRDFMSALIEENKSGRLDFKGMMGAVFGSYGWDGGDSVIRFSNDFRRLGIKEEAPVLVQFPMHPHQSIRERALSQCREFGEHLAEKASLRT
jgi:flavorubredoxin